MVKTITINDEAYAALKKLKQTPRDSFSKVILRLTGKKRSLLEFAGVWKDMSQEEADAIIARSREMWDAWDKPADLEDI